MKRFVVFAFCCVAAPLSAHPHIFVDTGLEIVTDDQGRATHVRVTWAYDALYSLLVTEDMGLDADGNAVLTPEEEAALTGFDTQWIDGFNGDLVGDVEGDALVLSGPTQPTAKMREGRIVTSHLRAIENPPLLDGRVLTFRPYDASFYTAYDVTMGVNVTGTAACDVALQAPQMDEDLAELKEQLSALDMNQDATLTGGPDIGAAFATEVRITCGG